MQGRICAVICCDFILIFSYHIALSLLTPLYKHSVINQNTPCYATGRQYCSYHPRATQKEFRQRDDKPYPDPLGKSMAKQKVGSVPAKCVHFPPLCLLCYSPETRKTSVQPWAERSPPAKTPKAVSHHWQFLEQTRLRGEPRECCKSGLRHIGRALWESLPGVCLLLVIFLSALDASFFLQWSTAPSHSMLIIY